MEVVLWIDQRGIEKRSVAAVLPEKVSQVSASFFGQKSQALCLSPPYANLFVPSHKLQLEWGKILLVFEALTWEAQLSLRLPIVLQAVCPKYNSNHLALNVSGSTLVTTVTGFAVFHNLALCCSIVIHSSPHLPWCCCCCRCLFIVFSYLYCFLEFRYDVCFITFRYLVFFIMFPLLGLSDSASSCSFESAPQGLAEAWSVL